jgi:hypothetical protein
VVDGLGYSGATEEYDGSTWTSSPASMSTARNQLGGAGTQTAALAFGGNTGTATAATEEWTRSRFSINKNNNGKLIWQII